MRAGQHARVAAPPPADAIDVTPSNAALTRSRSNPAGVWAARAFLLIGALCGLALALVTPPLRWGDENTHLIQAYRLSELNFTLLPAMKATRVELPRGVGKLLLTRSLELERKRHKGPESLKALRRKLAIEARSNDRRPVHLLNATYPLLGYVPQALGIAGARMLSSSVLVQLYAARFANVAAWLLLGWAAIRSTPCYRLAFAALALAPLSVFVASTLAVDGVTNGLALLWTACVVRLATSDTGSPPRLVPLALLATALAVVKLAYAPLVLLLFLVPAERFGGVRRQIFAVATILAVALATLALWFVVARWQVAKTVAPHGMQTVADNLVRIGHEPLAVAAMIGEMLWLVARKSLLLQVDTIWFLRSPSTWAFVAWVAAVACAVLAEPRPTLWPGLRARATAVAAVVLTTVGISLLAFLLWTRAGADSIDGVQSRYIVPLLPALLVGVSPRGAWPTASRARLVLAAGALVLLVAVLTYTVQRGLRLWV
ncbi:MAG TPA: DUF2142 domain-containing protein [Candidatus Binatia bacterium]